MAWLLLAAESRELDGLRRHCRSLGPFDGHLTFAECWEWGGQRWIVAANGPGPRLAFDAVKQVARREPLDGVMNTGYCGALNPELKVGDIVAPARVLALESGEAFDCAPFRGPDPQSRGVLISMDRVAVTAAEKAALHARGADVVEMEAAGAATAARELAIPFVTIRAVSDGAGQDLPLDFNQFRDAGGRFRRPRIALASLGSPASVLPGLLRLDRNSRLASRSLGDFLADCRF